jgi:hypothetical protein
MVDLYVSESNVYRSSQDEYIDVAEEYFALEKENRKTLTYHQGLFEWTYFKAIGNGKFILLLIIAIINRERLGENYKFEAKVDSESDYLIGEIS